MKINASRLVAAIALSAILGGTALAAPSRGPVRPPPLRPAPPAPVRPAPVKPTPPARPAPPPPVVVVPRQAPKPPVVIFPRPSPAPAPVATPRPVTLPEKPKPAPRPAPAAQPAPATPAAGPALIVSPRKGGDGGNPVTFNKGFGSKGNLSFTATSDKAGKIDNARLAGEARIGRDLKIGVEASKSRDQANLAFRATGEANLSKKVIAGLEVEASKGKMVMDGVPYDTRSLSISTPLQIGPVRLAPYLRIDEFRSADGASGAPSHGLTIEVSF